MLYEVITVESAVADPDAISPGTGSARTRRSGRLSQRHGLCRGPETVERKPPGLRRSTAGRSVDRPVAATTADLRILPAYPGYPPARPGACPGSGRTGGRSRARRRSGHRTAGSALGATSYNFV